MGPTQKGTIAVGYWKITIRHPEWLECSKPGESIRLYREGKIPKAIDGWMLVVSLKHPLRAIYGSDLRAALALLGQALSNLAERKIKNPLARFLYWVPFVYAWLWTQVAGSFMKYPLWGRRESPEPVRCSCGWAGMRKWTNHEYHDDGSGQDVEPCDECPRCGAEI